MKIDNKDIEILTYLADGKISKEIASIINLNHKTVEHKITVMRYKLDCTNTTSLIAKAIRQKIIVAIMAALLFASCKEKKHEPYFPDLSVMSRPSAMLPIRTTSYYSIEEKKLDTVIALLKKQNRLLEFLRDRSFEKKPPMNAGTINLPPVIFYPDTLTAQQLQYKK